MKVLYDTCTIGDFMMGFSAEETPQSLAEICESNTIAAILDVNPAECAHLTGELFILKGNHLLYTPAFEEVRMPNGDYVFFVLKSIMHPENVLQILDTSYVTFNTENWNEFVFVNDKPAEPVHLEGIFGIAQVGASIKVCSSCWARVILAANGNYYRLACSEGSDKITILPNLSDRVSLDKYVNTVQKLASMLRPTTSRLMLPLSKDVLKPVDIHDTLYENNQSFIGRPVSLIRADGILVKDVYVQGEVLDYLAANVDYIGYKDERGKIVITKKGVFTRNVNGCKVLPSISGECKFFTDQDRAVLAEDFYIKGYFGTNTAGVPITYIVPFGFTSMRGNKLTFYVSQEANDIFAIRMLCVESPDQVTLGKLIQDVITIGSATQGRYVSVGLSIAPTTSGIIK